MSQPAVPTASHGYCSRCGAPLPGPVPACPRCGNAVAGKRRTNWTMIIVIASVVLLGAPCVLGVLAAIAIPNFIRYQLRSKVSELPVEVRELVKVEQAQLAGAGRYVALPRMPAGPPGTTKGTLAPEEQERAAAVGWQTAGALYGRYAVAVSEDGGAAAICAESDIDGDGVPAVRVAFLPDAHGNAPPAPCTAPVAYAGQPALEVVEASAPDVF